MHDFFIALADLVTALLEAKQPLEERSSSCHATDHLEGHAD